MPPAAAPPMSPMAWLRFDIVERWLREITPVQSVLEIGAGQGGVGARLAARASYVGLEPDEQSARVASQRLREANSCARVIRGDIDAISPQEMFDVACAFEVLEHLEDDHGALKNWTAHVRPGGHLILSVPAHRSRFSARDEFVGHYRRYDVADLDALLDAVGLETRHRVLYGFPLGYVLEAGRDFAARRARARRPDTHDQRVAASGRLYQPSHRSAVLTRMLTAPFRRIQRLTPNRGVGLLVLARVPEG